MCNMLTKIETKSKIEPGTGRLDILVGVSGAVATIMIIGKLTSDKGLSKPIGLITQLATIRMKNNEEKRLE